MLCNSFLGLAQTGAWGCFDDFDRINIEVLSVFAQQIHCILSAIAERAKRFVFEGQEINLVLSCGIFITLNPGRKYLMTVFMRRMGFMFVKCNEV
jgi:dynein heavy chain